MLCGRDGDFRACPRIQHVVRFGCNGAADNVHDGEHTTARTLRFAQRRQRIGGLAGLADDDHERVFVEDWVAVTELRCNIHFDRDAQQFFKRVLCHDAHVYAVPHATMLIFVKRRSSSAVKVMSSSTMCPLRIRGVMVSRTAFGCSKISFIMKCSKPALFGAQYPTRCAQSLFRPARRLRYRTSRRRG